MEKKLIEAEQLTFKYQHAQNVLNNLSFSAASGEAVGLAGANGAGKSTLLQLLTGLHLTYLGSLKVAGLSVKKANLSEIRAKTGYVLQDSENQLFMPTAYEDVAFAPRNYGLSKSEVQQRTEEALALTGSMYLKNRRIYQMSGGEKKLIAIACVLSMKPEILLMDEPSAALDPRNRRNLIQLLNSFSMLKLIASHDLDFLLDTCSRVILLDSGRMICDGRAEDVLTDEKLLEAHGLELPLSLYRR